MPNLWQSQNPYFKKWGNVKFTKQSLYVIICMLFFSISNLKFSLSLSFLCFQYICYEKNLLSVIKNLLFVISRNFISRNLFKNDHSRKFISRNLFKIDVCERKFISRKFSKMVVRESLSRKISKYQVGRSRKFLRVNLVIFHSD